ncbi:MAG TPA: hypothetical protein VGH27_23685 [Streptosporangiaceae bacterium]|jgi:hypothetical protein
MTQPHDELYDSLQSFRIRNRLIRDVRAGLKGTRLETRELTDRLAICNPRDTELGRIYVNYARAEVSLRRTVWEYLGCLQGYGSSDPEAEPGIDAAKIIGILTERNEGSR